MNEEEFIFRRYQHKARRADYLVVKENSIYRETCPGDEKSRKIVLRADAFDMYRNELSHGTFYSATTALIIFDNFAGKLYDPDFNPDNLLNVTLSDL